MITFLAIIFLAALLIIAVAGIRLLQNKSRQAVQDHKEKCTFCQNYFDKTELVVRQIGDTRLLYFCRSCILKLFTDAGLKN